MKLRQIFLSLIFLSSYLPLLAQVDTAWVRTYNGPGNGVDSVTAIAVDMNGYVYVTGASWSGGADG